MKQKSKSLLKCIMTFVLTVVMVMGALPLDGLVMEVYAETTTITPTTPSQDANGYYLIGTAAELYGFAEVVNNGNAEANGKLTADIIVNENVLDANGNANTGDFVQWISIGNHDQNKTYSGTFDGQGHTVSGLYVSGSGWRVGFIGEVSGSAVVKNLGIVDSYFSSSNNFLGSIVGKVSDNSSVTLANVYSTSTVKGDNWIGGLAGGDGDGSVSVVNSYFAGKTIADFESGQYGSHHDDLVAGVFDRSTLTVCNAFVLGTSQYGTSVTPGQLSDGTVAATLHYYQDALADGSMFGISDGKTAFSSSLEGVSVTTAGINLHTFDGDATAYSSKYVVGNTTSLPVNVVRSGYKFAGWYDNADLKGDAVTSISSSETGKKEYWAKFERSHSVTFVLNDGCIQTGEIDHYIEGETTALPTMVNKNSASFEGWYTTEDFTGNRYYFIPSTATEDMAFYAKWGEAKTTFYLKQGGSPESVNVLYEGENVVYLDKTTEHGYYVSDEDGDFWGGSSGRVNVPYTGGESTFGNGGRAFNVAQSGFYVFTLTDKGEGKWFVSVLYHHDGVSVSGSAKYGAEGMVDLSSLIEVGGNLGTVSASDSDNVLDGTPTIEADGKTLKFKFANNSSKVGKTATVTIPVEGATNYKDYNIVVTLTVAEKIVPTLAVSDYTKTYDGNSVTISDLTKTAKDGSLNVDGTWDFEGTPELKNVSDSGTITVRFTPTDTASYESATATFMLTINRKSVTVKAESYTVKKGDTLPTFYYDVTGLVNNETLPITVSIACTASDTNTAGTYDITVSGVSSEGNYTYVYTNGVLEVLAEDEAPFIKGDDGKMGWDAISDEIEDANKEDSIVVDMNGATVVPGDIIEEARDKGITISIVLDNGLTWTIDGSTVTDGDISNINLDTTVEDENNPLNNIPVDVINGVTGEKATIEVNLKYSGNFGFTAVLKANLRSDNAGYYANLYYYNPTTGKLEYMCADVIASNGEAELTFTHASDYLIVIDDEDLGKAPDDDDDDDDGSDDGNTTTEDKEGGKDEAPDDDDDDDNNTTEDKEDGKDEVPDTGDAGTLYLWIIMISAALGMLGVTGVEKLHKRRKNR